VADSIPILDLAESGRERRRFAGDLGAAFREFGFVGIRGHGVPEEVIRAGLSTARAFFALPEAVKRRCEVEGGAGQRGYTRLGVEKAKDQQRPDRKEFFHVGREVARDHPLAHALQRNVWPAEASAELKGFRESQLALFGELERVGARLLGSVALDLGLRDDWFAQRIGRGNSILRAIHYPPFADEDVASRAAAHEDINLITLLVGSEEPGLEIKTRAGEWIGVTTLPGTIVVNAGDMLERLTNDLLPSTTHRVVRPPPPWDRRSRWSIPFFLHFDPDVVIETLPGCISRERPDRHPIPITADDFLKERLREIGLLREY
jgi:isopenicillin N synthase-like dioxygenase